MANVLKNLGSVHACVVHGRDGMDEVTLCDETLVAELVDGQVKTYTVKPEDLGLARVKIDTLKVDGVEGSARVIRDVLANTPGPALDIVLLNSAFGLLAADVVKDPKQGLAKARDVVASGKPAECLRKLVDITSVIT
jgi:anthranilate phosphoribosyltransferase